MRQAVAVGGRGRWLALGLVAAVALAALTLAANSSARARPTCFGKRATIVGTNHNDVIKGTPGKDVIAALGGRDVVEQHPDRRARQ